MSLKDVTTKFNLLASILNSGMDLEDEGDEIQVGDTITVNTAAYGIQPGRVESICDNPFYGQSGMMAFVVSLEGEPFWTDYINVEAMS